MKLSEKIQLKLDNAELPNWDELNDWQDEVAQTEAELEIWKRPIICHWCLEEPEEKEYETHWKICEKSPAGKAYRKLEAEIGTCSIDGQKPAVLVDRKHKGTYWLCGDCMGEKIEDKMKLETENDALKELDVNGLREVAKELSKSKPPYRWSSLWRDTGLRQQQIGEQLLRLCAALEAGGEQ